MGVIWTAITYSLEEAAELSYLCIGCGACDEVCPVEIPLSGILWRLKTLAAGKEGAPGRRGGDT